MESSWRDDPRRNSRIGLVLLLFTLVWGCGAASTGTEAESRPTPARRPVLSEPGAASPRGISYGPYREGQAPGGAQPSEAQLLEDLRILAEHWDMLRIYSSLGPAEPILRLIRDHDIPMRVMLGAWVHRERRDDDGLDPEKIAANEAEAESAIRLAHEYDDIVFAVCVGNETQVEWSGHRTRAERLVELIRRVRAGVPQPVATADDYNFWNKPESEAVAREIDFLVLHAYAMWNRQELEDAVPWTATTVRSIRELHPDLTIVLGETGWATRVHPTGDAARQIVGDYGEAEQARFYREFTAWAESAELPYFFFEAFDEPWKGGPHPDEVEKHWGLYNVDRTPKLAMRSSHGLANADP